MKNQASQDPTAFYDCYKDMYWFADRVELGLGLFHIVAVLSPWDVQLFITLCFCQLSSIICNWTGWLTVSRKLTSDLTSLNRRATLVNWDSRVLMLSGDASKRIKHWGLGNRGMHHYGQADQVTEKVQNICQSESDTIVDTRLDEVDSSPYG